MSLLGRKGHGGEHEEGEAWLISYADMMTLLFGLFVILYSFSQVDEKKFDALRKDMAETFGGKFEETFGSDVGHLTESRRLRAFQMLVSMMNLGDDMDSAVRRIEKETAGKAGDVKALREMAKKMQEKNAAVLRPVGASDHETVIDIALGDRFLFEPGGDVLRPEAMTKLREIGVELNRLKAGSGVEIIGHSDGSPTRVGTKVDNWSLSAQRAASVARALIKFGVDKSRFKVSGMGDLQPLFPEKTEDGRPIPGNMARNRRVHIVVKKVVDDEGP